MIGLDGPREKMVVCEWLEVDVETVGDRFDGTETD